MSEKWSCDKIFILKFDEKWVSNSTSLPHKILLVCPLAMLFLSYLPYSQTGVRKCRYQDIHQTFIKYYLNVPKLLQTMLAWEQTLNCKQYIETLLSS